VDRKRVSRWTCVCLIRPFAYSTTKKLGKIGSAINRIRLYLTLLVSRNPLSITKLSAMANYAHSWKRIGQYQSRFCNDRYSWSDSDRLWKSGKHPFCCQRQERRYVVKSIYLFRCWSVVEGYIKRHQLLQVYLFNESKFLERFAHQMIMCFKINSHNFQNESTIIKLQPLKLLQWITKEIYIRAINCGELFIA